MFTSLQHANTSFHLVVLFPSVLPLVGVHTAVFLLTIAGKNLYNNEHVAIKLVSCGVIGVCTHVTYLLIAYCTKFASRTVVIIGLLTP